MVTSRKTSKSRPAAKVSKKTAAKKAPTRPAAKRTPSASGNSPDAIAFLTKDHRDAKKLFKQFEKLDRKKEKEALAETVCKMLTVHTTIEEEIFYPACREAGLDADQMDEADVEHASAKELIAQIQGMSADESHYDAKVKVLGEYVNHHVEEEESEMFKSARRLSLDMKELGRQLKTRATELKMEEGLLPSTKLLSTIGERVSSWTSKLS